MNTYPINVNGNGFRLDDGTIVSSGGPLGHSYVVWRSMQHGGSLARWGMWLEEFPELRKQLIFEHMISVADLMDQKAGLMNSVGCSLDRSLIQRAARLHDFSEPLRRRDVPATKKTAADDLAEYLVFKRVNEGLGAPLWPERQEAFLLQTCIDNDPVFPRDARDIMRSLYSEHRWEAIFFKAMEWYDYLHSAFEGTYESEVEEMLPTVSARHVPMLDSVVEKWPEFGRAVWTPEVRRFFAEAASHYHVTTFGPTRRQLELFAEP